MMRAAFVPPAPAPASPPPGCVKAHRARLPGTVAGVLVAHAAALWVWQGVWSARSPTPLVPSAVQATLLPAPSAAAFPTVPAALASSVERPALPQPPQRSHPLAAATRPPSAAAPAPVAPSVAPPPAAPLATTAPLPSAPEPSDLVSAAPALAASSATTDPGPPALPNPAPPATHGPAAASVTTRIDLPSAHAAYLSNPPPPYPALSRRLGEHGKVVVRVRIETDGAASAAEIHTSSGFERLDQAALQTVLRWTYVPGKRDGVPQAMWYLIPIEFVLE